jgi:cytochrome c
LPYTISVWDAEDGNTEYNEIPSNEVLLVAKYVSDSILIEKNSFSEEMIRHHDAVLALSRSNCFSCHAAKEKLIGPSFEEVATRYKNSAGAIEQLAKKVIDGSTGTWSDLKMPPHPDLEAQHVREMVTWILKNNSDQDFVYFVGTEGSLKISPKPATARRAGVYVLTASYMDHGYKNPITGGVSDRKRGKHSVILKNAE